MVALAFSPSRDWQIDLCEFETCLIYRAVPGQSRLHIGEKNLAVPGHLLRSMSS